MARKEVVAYQLRLDEPPKPRSRFVYEPGEFALLREQTEVEHCYQCERLIVGRRIRHQEIYQPFNVIPTVYHYCEPCCDQGYDQSASSMWCESCSREVWESNGYRVNVKPWPGSPHNDYACVACIQKFYLEHGHTDEEIEGGTIPCDWYDHAELRARGWTEGEAFGGDMLERSGGEEWREYCRLIKLAGGIVLTDQGRTSIIGGPDSVTVWFKLPTKEEGVD